MLLQMRGRLSASVLAGELEVSVRTIYRDIDALSASGVPIYAELGRAGGVALQSGYRTRLTGLTSAEAAALPMSGLAQVARDLGVSAEAAAAQLKILASLPAESGGTAQRIAARFHIDPAPWYHRAEVLERLPTLAAAVWQGRRIVIAYQSWKGDAVRRLDPLGLAQKGGIWYLVASARGTPRTYRVSGIRSLEVLDEDARRPDGFDLARYWQRWVDDFEHRLMSGRARVRISDEGQRILRAVMPAAAEVVAATQVPTSRPGWNEADLPFETPDYSARQLLRLGADVEVLAPDALRDAVLREARAVAALYRRAVPVGPTLTSVKVGPPGLG
jgi:predicted DNA-binding transcriptional regulator YafY